MKIAVLGAAGMLGRKLAAALVAQGTLAGQAISGLILQDIAAPPRPGGAVDTRVLAGDIAGPAAFDGLLASRPAVIYHLAAVVSGEAEADLDKGYRVNLEGTRSLLEAIRAVGGGYRPRLVFTSSLAVFGGSMPDVIPDDFPTRPLSSYGAQKAMGELLVADYSRRGIVDGISLRLPTICVRPGRPNAAASSFYSSILREPLNGEPAILPVPETMRHWFASPRAAIRYLLRAAELPGERLGTIRSLTMPGISATVAEQIEALRQVAGEKAVALIRKVPDDRILAIVSTWPKAFDARLALDLGFEPDDSMAEIVRIYRDDELKAPSS